MVHFSAHTKQTALLWYLPRGTDGHVLVTEFRGVAVYGLFCTDVLRPLDLVPLTDFTYKYYPDLCPLECSLVIMTFIIWHVHTSSNPEEHFATRYTRYKLKVKKNSFTRMSSFSASFQLTFCLSGGSVILWVRALDWSWINWSDQVRLPAATLDKSFTLIYASVTNQAV